MRSDVGQALGQAYQAAVKQQCTASPSGPNIASDMVNDFGDAAFQAGYQAVEASQVWSDADLRRNVSQVRWQYVCVLVHAVAQASCTGGAPQGDIIEGYS